MTATPPVASQASSTNLPAVSVVVVNWNTRGHITKYLEMLRSGDRSQRDCAVVVVDNASTDRSVEAIRAACPAIPVLENPENRGYAAAVNQGVAHTPKTPYVLIANADVICGLVAIAAMAQWLDQHPKAAVVGPCLRNNDGTLQLSWGREPHLLTEFIQRWWWRRLETRGELEPYATQLRQVDWVLGACFMVRREAFEAAGRMDEGYFMYFEEVDLCTRLRRAGWQVWYLPESIAAAIHYGRASTGQAPEAMAVAYRRSQLRYYQKFHGRWAARLLWQYLNAKLIWSSGGRRILHNLSQSTDNVRATTPP